MSSVQQGPSPAHTSAVSRDPERKTQDGRGLRAPRSDPSFLFAEFMLGECGLKADQAPAPPGPPSPGQLQGPSEEAVCSPAARLPQGAGSLDVHGAFADPLQSHLQLKLGGARIPDSSVTALCPSEASG